MISTKIMMNHIKSNNLKVFSFSDIEKVFKCPYSVLVALDMLVDSGKLEKHTVYMRTLYKVKE